MSEKMRIGGIILLVKSLLIGPLLHLYMISWPGLLACLAVSLGLMALAFLFVRPRTSDILLFVYGEAVQFLSAGGWFFIAQKSRQQIESLGDVYQCTLSFQWDTQACVYLFVGGLFQTMLLFFFRKAARYDAGWRD